MLNRKVKKASAEMQDVYKIDRRKQVGSLPYIWSKVSKNRGAMVGMCLVAFILIMSFLSPYIMKDFTQIDMLNRFSLPSWEHPFGTDELGRDMMARAFYGARFTLAIGVGAVIISTIFGVLIGSIAGYFGGMLDTILMRCLDVVQSCPPLILAIALATVIGAGVKGAILAIGIANIPVFARLMRANILTIRSSEYIEAAVSIKCSTPKIILRHVIPNALSPLIVQISMSLATAGLNASSLSFLGLGVSEPNPEWGAMISSARTFIREYPHLVIIPGIFIMATVLSLNMIGDALRDALDPKLKD